MARTRFPAAYELPSSLPIRRDTHRSGRLAPSSERQRFSAVIDSCEPRPVHWARAVGWAVSSAVEHCFHTAGATGSIPVPPTIKASFLEIQAFWRSSRASINMSLLLSTARDAGSRAFNAWARSARYSNSPAHVKDDCCPVWLDPARSRRSQSQCQNTTRPSNSANYVVRLLVFWLDRWGRVSAFQRILFLQFRKMPGKIVAQLHCRRNWQCQAHDRI
jgi:hypothetical protein